MRYALLSSVFGTALLSGVCALPVPDGDSCPAPQTSTATEYTPYPTPTPYPDDDPYPLPTDIPATETSEPIEEPTETPTEPVNPEPEPTETPTPEPASCKPAWDMTGKAPSTGTLRAALLFVDFPDSPSTDFPQTIDELYAPLASQPSDLYATMSYGKLNFELVPYLDGFIRMPGNAADYTQGGFNYTTHKRYIEDAVATVGTSFDFTDIDVLIIAPPNGTEAVSRSAVFNGIITTADGTTFTAGNSITFGQDLYNYWQWKTLNHEVAHAMGLPDLYPISDDPDFAGGNGYYVGGFDLMAVIGGQSPDMFAWHKWKLSWVEDSQIECLVENGVTEHRISPIELEGGSKAIAIPVNGTGYVMAEVRSKNGVDVDACDEAVGLLIYTTDSTRASGDGSVRVIDTNPDTEGCGTFDRGSRLNNAPLQGEQMTFSTDLGVDFTILAVDGEDYIVQVERNV